MFAGIDNPLPTLAGPLVCPYNDLYFLSLARALPLKQVPTIFTGIEIIMTHNASLNISTTKNTEQKLVWMIRAMIPNASPMIESIKIFLPKEDFLSSVMGLTYSVVDCWVILS